MSELDINNSWQAFIKAAHFWASQHMDQWERVKFQTEFGTIYILMDRKGDGFPFDSVDADGNPTSAGEVKP